MFLVNTCSVAGLSKLVKITEWARTAGLTQSKAYKAVSLMPNGVRVQLGGRVYLNLDRLSDWLEKGGNVELRKQPEGA